MCFIGSFLICFVMSIFCCCSISKSSDSDRTIVNDASHQVDQSPKTTDTSVLDFTNGNSNMAKAWQHFTQHGRYRMATTGDFNIPEWAISRFVEPRQYQRPYVSTPMGNIVIVIDTTKKDAARFGVVIFDVVENTDEINEPYWLYRDRDLSRSVLTALSRGCVLTEYDDKEKINSCFIQWNQQQHKYTCDNKP